MASSRVTCGVCVQEFLRKTVHDLHIQVDLVNNFCNSLQREENQAQATMVAAMYDAVTQRQTVAAAVQPEPAMQEMNTKVSEFQRLVDNELEELRRSVDLEYRKIGLQQQVHHEFRVPENNIVRLALCRTTVRRSGCTVRLSPLHRAPQQRRGSAFPWKAACPGP